MESRKGKEGKGKGGLMFAKLAGCKGRKGGGWSEYVCMWVRWGGCKL